MQHRHLGDGNDWGAVIPTVSLEGGALHTTTPSPRTTRATPLGASSMTRVIGGLLPSRPSSLLDKIGKL